MNLRVDLASCRRLTILLIVICAMPYASAQEPAATLRVDLENWVNYAADAADLTKVAKDPARLTATPPVNFSDWVSIADVVAINGTPAKGVMVMRMMQVSLAAAPGPGQAVSDVSRNSAVEIRWEFLKPDGSPIGSVFGMGFSGGRPAPGSPMEAVAGNLAIVGGTGAFVGARGAMNSVTASFRNTSQAEDPSMRRAHGGGAARFNLQLLPAYRPAVVTTAAGPAVFHADFTPVSEAKPAKPGEQLILFVKGLGPTNPPVTAGDPFPEGPLAEVTALVEVIVDEIAVPAVNQIGVPRTSDTYRVDFRVPEATKVGLVAIQVSAAWIVSMPVLLAVR